MASIYFVGQWLSSDGILYFEEGLWFEAWFLPIYYGVVYIPIGLAGGMVGYMLTIGFHVSARARMGKENRRK